MAIDVDSSSPAIVVNTSSTLTTSSFNPPANSLIVACVGYEAASGDATITMSCPAGATLTWAERARRDEGDSGAEQGVAAIFTAVNLNAQTGVTVRSVSSVSNDAGGLKVFVVTGVDLTNPIGTTGEGSSTTRNLTVSAYTSTAASSRGFATANDWNDTGTPTSTDTGFAYNVSGTRSAGIAVYKAADTATPGTSVSFNFNAGGSSPAWNWCAVEVLPLPAPPGQTVHVYSGAVHRASRW